jgi:hypothetical protein
MFDFQEMKYTTEYQPHEIERILLDQVDAVPPIFRALIGLKADRYRGTSKVCGSIVKNVFRLKNRKDPYFSEIAEGKVASGITGSEVEIEFKKPKIQDYLGVFFFRRYSEDRKVILLFLKEWLKLKEEVEPQFLPDR